MDVVHNIENVEVKAADDSEESGNTEVSTPVNPVKITSIRVETNGVDYGLPETLTPFDYMSWMYQQYGIDPSTMTGEQGLGDGPKIPKIRDLGTDLGSKIYNFEFGK